MQWMSKSMSCYPESMNTYHFYCVMAIGNDNLDIDILLIELLDLLDRDLVMSICNSWGKVIA